MIEKTSKKDIDQKKYLSFTDLDFLLTKLVFLLFLFGTIENERL